MQIQKKSLNWMPRASQWQEARQQRAKRQEFAQGAIAQRQALTAQFASVQDNLAYGRSEIAAKTAAARIQAEGRAKLQNLDKLL